MTAAGEDHLATPAPRLTKVEPSLHWHEAPLTSARHRRLAEKWPWSWRCTAPECVEAYGAARSKSEAQDAADDHEHVAHNCDLTDQCGRDAALVRGLDLITGTYPIPSCDSVVGQTPPIEGDRVT